ELVGLAARASEAVLESSGRVLSVETMRQCNGNPLALLHLSSEPTTAGGQPDARQQLPARLKADFRRTIEKLPADSRVALSLFAVAGSVPAEVGARALARLGVSDDALEPAVAAGVVAADGTFRHPLWGAAAMPERAEAAIVHDALADAYRDDERLTLLHRLLGSGPHTDELLSRSQALGDRLLAGGHVEDAHALFVAAAGVDDDTGRRALAWAKAGQCLSVSVRWAEAAPFYERALNDADTEPIRVRVLRELVWVQVLAGGTVDAAAARLRSSLSDAGTHTGFDPVRLAEAWGSLIGLHLVSDVHRALAAEVDIPAEAGVLGEVLAAHCLANTPRGPSARNQIRAQAAGEGEVHGLFAVSGFHLELLEIEGSWSEYAAGSKLYYDEVRATHQLNELGPALSRRVSGSVFLGDATTAFGYALAAMEHAPQECTVLGYSSFAAAVVGSPHADEWAVTCDRIGSSTGLTEHVVKANHRRGFTRMASDDLDAAEPFMRRCWRLLHTQGYAHPGFAFARGDIAETFARLALVDDARAVIAELETGPFDLAWARGVAARARGLLGERGQFEKALGLLADSPWETARTQLAWARQVRANDGARSLALAEAALRGFEVMGARPWAAQARSVMTPPAETPDPTPALLPELSDRERTVALAVARGLSNKEVAAELYISNKTVDAHLQQIYRKLDLRSRNQLTAMCLGSLVR
ncbi:MAG: LuxR C-terminal-related transcriptional regulator, partial [Ilumatobacteraceae bacterium]